MLSTNKPEFTTLNQNVTAAIADKLKEYLFTSLFHNSAAKCK